MLNPTIKIGNKNVVATGVFITFNDEPSILEFKIKKELYTFNFHFKNTESEKIQVKLSPISDREVQLDFFNFNSALGSSPIKPHHLGKISGKSLYLNALIKKLNDQNQSKVVEYSFYLEN